MLYKTMFHFCLVLGDIQFKPGVGGLHEFRFDQVLMKGLPVRAISNVSAFSSSASASLQVSMLLQVKRARSPFCGKLTGGIQACLLPAQTTHQLLHLRVSSNAPSRQEQNSVEGTAQKKLNAV